MSKAVNIISGFMTMSIVVGAIAVVVLSTPTVDQEQHNCLALNIYHEARGEPVEGQAAVAHTTINRVNHTNWPDTICEVVYQPYQFSWTHMIEQQTPLQRRAWKTARTIAHDVMTGTIADSTNGAVFYHAEYVNPSWAEYVDLSKVIGLHLFYTWDGDWNADN